jgi:2-oxoglutarate dehydrogenase E1 component
VRRNFRKPLILMAPKSMLRAPEMMSKLADMGPSTSFHRVFADHDPAVDPAKARRVVLTTGKVHFDLAKYRAENKINDVALIRIEQLYPFPYNTLATVLAPYKNAEFVWCQEEPENMGAWHFVDRKLEKVLAGIDVKGKRARYVGRPEAAATATGQLRRHNAQQAQLVAEAFAK